MNDDLPFIRAICESPDDDAPRLIYADWLDENGESERAGFIRVQIKLAELAEHEYRPGEPEYATEQSLRHRESEVLAGNNRRWAQPLPGPLEVSGDFNWQFRRGFLHSITCTAPDWLAHGDAIRDRHPVREVRLTTEPDWGNDWGTWADGFALGSRTVKLGRWPGITFHLPPMPRRSTMMGYPMTWEPDEFWRPTDEQINDLYEQVMQLRIQALSGRPDIIIDIDGDRLIAVLAVSEDGGRYVPRRFAGLINAL